MNGVITKPLMKADPSAEGFAPVSTTGVMTVREYVGWEDLQRALAVDHLESQWEALRQERAYRIKRTRGKHEAN